MTIANKVINVLFNVSQIFPDWFLKFNHGTIYHSSAPKLITRANSKYSVHGVGDKDIPELAVFSGLPEQVLRKRLSAGDIGLVTREKASGKIVTIQWARLSETYIRGFGFTLRLPPAAAYVYWALSAPEVRLTGVFNTAFLEMTNLLEQRGVKEYYGLVEFWNRRAHAYHHRINFNEHSKVTHVKFLFVRLSLQTNIQSRQRSFSLKFSEASDIDVI